MASDSLRQIGNYIKDTRKDTDFGLKRYHAIIPQIERARDVFDSEVPFKMTFKTEPGHEKVSLNLNFNLPPPLSQCNADCVKASCQTFDVTPGDHLLTVDNPYNEGSVAVFVDFVQSLPSGFEEVNPGAGTVFVQGSETTSTITICYTYGDCGADFNPCPDLLEAVPKAFVGLAPIFMDRFDRAGSETNPAGGCGYWEVSGTDSINLGNGFATINNAVATFEPIGVINDKQISSDNIELLLWFNIDFLASSVMGITFEGLGGYVSTLSLRDISGNFSFHATIPVRYIQTNIDPDGDSNNIGYSNAFKDVTFTAAETGTYFLRAAQISNYGVVGRLWKEGTEEPSTWDISITTSDFLLPPDTASPVANLPAVYGVAVSASTAKAIVIWGEPGTGAFDANRDNITSWHLAHCYPNPDGLTRFQHCNPAQFDVTNTGTGFAELHTDEPAMSVGLSWPHFVADTSGLGRLLHVGTSAHSFRNIGNAASVRISGEVKNSDSVFDLGYSVEFMAYDYGESEPSVANDVFIEGTSVGTVLTGATVWSPFSFEFPATGDGKYIQWGAVFAGGASGVESTLGAEAHYPQFLAVNNYAVGIQLKNLVIEGIGNIWCTTHPFCPDSVDDYNARCGNLVDFSGGNFSAFCNTAGNAFDTHSDFYTPVDGPQVEWSRGQGVSLTQSGGVEEVGFTAFGITTNGLDGLCPRKFAVYDTATGTRSMSDSSGQIILGSPFDCTTLGGEMYFEFRVPDISLGSWSSTTGTQFPELELVVGDDNGFQSAIFIGDSGFSNYLFISGTQNGTYTLANPVTTTDWYACRIQVFINDGDTDQTIRIRYWKVGDVEPSTWLIEDTLAFGPINRMRLETDYSEYIDDTTVVQYRNVTITGEAF